MMATASSPFGRPFQNTSSACLQYLALRNWFRAPSPNWIIKNLQHPAMHAFARELPAGRGPPAGLLGAMEPTTPGRPRFLCWMAIAADRSQRSTARAVRLGDAFLERLRRIAPELAPKFYPVLSSSWRLAWPN
jgi:hypothetical protein